MKNKPVAIHLLIVVLALLFAGCASEYKSARKPAPAPPPLPRMVSKAGVILAAAGVVPMAPGQFVSVSTYGGSFADTGLAVGVDGAGNSFVGGYTDGSGGVTHPFLAKRSPTGATLWSTSFGTPSWYGAVKALAVDTQGNVIIAGAFLGVLDFGGVTIESTHSRYDTFIAKLSSNGTHIWSQHFGGSISDTTGTAYGLAVDKGDDSVVVTGLFDVPTDFGGGLVMPYYQDLFLLKLSANGSFQWARRVGGVNVTTTGTAVAVDAGNVFLTGGTVSYGLGATTIDFGAGPIPAGQNAIAAKYTGANGYVWAQSFGGTRIAQANGITVDAGNPIIVGKYTGNISFGGIVLTNPPESGFVSPSSAFIARLTGGSGAHAFSARLGDGQNGQAFGASVDANNNVTVVGLISAGSTSLGTLNISPAGVTRWSHPIAGKGVAADVERLFVAGTFSGTFDFGGGPVTATGQGDMYVAEYATGSTNAVGPPLTIEGPYPSYDADGNVNTNFIMWVVSTFLPSNTIVSIEASPNTLFNFSQAAIWFCYRFNATAAGFFTVPVTQVATYYKATFTPCEEAAVAAKLTMGKVAEKPKKKTKSMTKWLKQNKGKGNGTWAEAPQPDEPKFKNVRAFSKPK